MAKRHITKIIYGNTNKSNISISCESFDIDHEIPELSMTYTTPTLGQNVSINYCGQDFSCEICEMWYNSRYYDFFRMKDKTTGRYYDVSLKDNKWIIDDPDTGWCNLRL